MTEGTTWTDGSAPRDAHADEPSIGTSLRTMIVRHWLPLGQAVAFVASPLSYMLLSGVPAVALFVSTLFMVIAFALLVALVWPMGHYITWARRLEVLGHRAAVGVTLYVVAGYGIILVINMLTTRTIPADWPEVRRFLPFWPFYTWFVVGCESIGPCAA